MSHAPPIHTVCPHCKRPVTVQPAQQHAHCLEHGQIVPMRSAIMNAPLATPLHAMTLACNGAG